MRLKQVEVGTGKNRRCIIKERREDSIRTITAKEIGAYTILTLSADFDKKQRVYLTNFYSLL